MSSKKLLLTIFFSVFLAATLKSHVREETSDAVIAIQEMELPHLGNIDKPIFIEEAVKLAFANRSDLLATYYATKAAYKNAIADLAGYFTQIGASAFIKATRKKFFHKEGQELVINQLIWSFAGPLQQYYISKQNVYIAELVEELTQDAIQFSTESSFLSYWQLIAQKFSKHALDLFSQKDFARSEEENRVGLLAAQDFLGAAAVYADRLFIVQSYFDDLETFQYTLERAMQQSFKKRGLQVQLDDDQVQRFVIESINSANEQLSIDHYLKLANLNRKELLIRDEEVTREKLVAQFLARTYLPSATFFTVVTRKGLPVGAPKLLWQVGIRFNWVFDGLQNAFRSQANKYVELAAIASRANEYQNIKLEVETTYQDLKVAVKNLEAQRIRTRQQEEEYYNQKRRYEVGDISYVIYTDAEHIWEVAKFDLLAAEVSTAVKYRELLFRCGYPDNE